MPRVKHWEVADHSLCRKAPHNGPWATFIKDITCKECKRIFRKRRRERQELDKQLRVKKAYEEKMEAERKDRDVQAVQHAIKAMYRIRRNYNFDGYMPEEAWESGFFAALEWVKDGKP